MFNLVIIIILVMFIFNIYLSVLNYRNRNKPIPSNVADVYSKSDYNKWLKYTTEIFNISTLSKIINTIVLILFLLFNVFNFFADVANKITSNTIFQTIIFLGMYSVLSYILNIGIDIYQTFSIENRYGFNKSTVKTFILDQFKSILLTIILGVPLLYLILILYNKLGDKSLIFIWIFLICISLILNILYTKIFVRIFNKLTPIIEGELFDKIEILVKKTGYELGKISIIDASKRSSRLNAYFSGFGKFKHIILYDTLLSKCTTDEIISILAHEIGHSKHNDVLKNYLISTLNMGIFLSMLGYFLNSNTFATAFGFDDVHIGFSLILFSILMEPFTLIINIPLSAISRKAEYKADAFSANLGFNTDMINALKILARENFSNLTPHPLIVKLKYSHPPITDRIKALSNGLDVKST